jgi:hypothetical protein
MQISMDMHRPVEAVIGFALIAVAFLVDLGTAALIIAVALGSVVLAVAYGAMRDDEPLPTSTHVAIDRLVVVGIGLAALIALATGHLAGGLILAALALAMTALVLLTRYVAEPRQRATTVTGR